MNHTVYINVLSPRLPSTATAVKGLLSTILATDPVTCLYWGVEDFHPHGARVYLKSSMREHANKVTLLLEEKGYTVRQGRAAPNACPSCTARTSRSRAS